MACCQPASADCSEELLRDGIPNDTAAAIATNCFDLIYFSFYNPAPPPPSLTLTYCCSSPLPPNAATQAFSLPLGPPHPVSLRRHRYIYNVRGRGRHLLVCAAPLAGNICLEVPLPQSVRVRVGHSLDWPVWKGPWAEQGRTGWSTRASRRKLVPRSILLGPPRAICMCLCVFCEDLGSTDSYFVGERAPRHQKQLKAASGCPLHPFLSFDEYI